MNNEEKEFKNSQSYPLYTIGVAAELLNLHPETIRVWEKSGAVQTPQRRSGKRFYSENDLKRLRFIRKLVGEGLTQRAILYYLRLYPCWKTVDCSGCLHSSTKTVSPKPCWQSENGYCQVSGNENPCLGCPLRASKDLEYKEAKIDSRRENHSKSAEPKI